MDFFPFTFFFVVQFLRFTLRFFCCFLIRRNAIVLIDFFRDGRFDLCAQCHGSNLLFALAANLRDSRFHFLPFLRFRHACSGTGAVRINVIIRNHSHCVGIHRNDINTNTYGSLRAGSTGCQTSGVSCCPNIVFSLQIKGPICRIEPCFIIYRYDRIAPARQNIQHTGNAGLIRHTGGIHNASLGIFISGINGNIASRQFCVLSNYDKAFAPHILVGRRNTGARAGRTVGCNIRSSGAGNGNDVGFRSGMNLLVPGRCNLRSFSGHYHGAIT